MTVAKKVYLWASLWWCEDEVCNCYQPKIEIVKYKQVQHLRVYDRKILWRGTFCSDPDPQEWQDMVVELHAKAKEYGITLDEYFSGQKEFYEVFEGGKK